MGMKRLWQLLGLFGLAALLFLVMPSLVQHHAEEQPGGAAELPLPAGMRLCAVETAPQETVPLPEMQRQGVRRSAQLPLRMEAGLDEGSQAALDGNGWPITGRTWPRCVYAVCPPEGVPG